VTRRCPLSATPRDREDRDGPTGLPRVARSTSDLEAARLRYELARLRDRRPVRAALALTSWRRGGLGPALASLRGHPPRWDVPGPTGIPDRPRYPHLRAATLSADPLLAGVVPTTQVRPGDLTAIGRDRVDLVLVDDVSGWSEPQLIELVDHARRTGAATVAVGPAAIAMIGDRAQLRIGPAGAGRVDLQLAPSIDPRVVNPVGRDVGVVAAPSDDEAYLAAIARGLIPLGEATPTRRELLGDLGDEVFTTGPDRARRLAELHADLEARDTLSVRLRRHVLTQHSRAARCVHLIEPLDLGPAPPRTIALLLATRRPELLPAVCDDLARQHRDDLELLVAVHGDAAVPERLAVAPAAIVRVAAARPLGELLNTLLDRTAAPLVAKIDDDDRYGPHHLVDLEVAMSYSGAELVGKRRHGVHDVAASTVSMPDGPAEERWEDHLPGATMLVRGEVLRAVRWRHVPSGVDTELVRAVHLAGGAAYSTHRFGFVRTRHGDHTFSPGERSFAGLGVAGGVEALLDV
jgi:hypothetical protein